MYTSICAIVMAAKRNRFWTKLLFQVKLKIDINISWRLTNQLNKCCDGGCAVAMVGGGCTTVWWQDVTNRAAISGKIKDNVAKMKDKR